MRLVISFVALCLLPGRGAANGCYDTCCFAPRCNATAPSLLPASASLLPLPRPELECPVGHTEKFQSCAVPCCVPNPGTSGSCCQLGRAPGPHANGTLAVPTEVQLAWQEFEVGSLNSFQMGATLLIPTNFRLLFG